MFLAADQAHRRDTGTAHGGQGNQPAGHEEVKGMQLTALLDAVGPEEGVQFDQAMPCRVFDAELWFAESPADVERAKALCLGCPVRQACLAGALERREPWGVWGGELFLAGVVVPRKRPRGRPRKCDVAA